MNIAIVGTGYVGLVSGTCFADTGANVTCVDVDENKIERLKNGEIPIYEPGLDELVKKNVAAGRLKFTTDLASVLDDVEIVFSAVGTPPDEAGFGRTGVARLIDAAAAIPQTDQQRLTGNGPAAAQRAPVAIPKEIVPTQEYRQKGFDEQTTTDDHGMHIFGIAKDQEGTLYYMVKNSWGESGNYKGIYYCSENFVAGKSIDIVVHKDALSKDMKKKLGIK